MYRVIGYHLGDDRTEVEHTYFCWQIPEFLDYIDLLYITVEVNE